MKAIRGKGGEVYTKKLRPNVLNSLEETAATLTKVLNVLRQENKNADANARATASQNTAQPSQSNQNAAASAQNTQQASTSTQSTNADTPKTSQDNTPDHSNGSSQQQAQAPASTPHSNASQPTSQDKASATTGTGTDTNSIPTNDAETLAKIIAALLALTQAMIHSLQQPQTTTASGTSGTQKDPVLSGAAALAEATAQAASNQILAAQGSTGASSSDSQAFLSDVTAALSSIGDNTALMKMLDDIQKKAQALLVPQDQTKNVLAATQSQALSDASATDITAQLALLDSHLKDLLASSRALTQNAPVPTGTVKASGQTNLAPTAQSSVLSSLSPQTGTEAEATTQSASQTAQTDLRATKNAPVKSAADVLQNQMTLGLNAQASASPVTGQGLPTNSSLSLVPDKSGLSAATDFDTESDLMSGGGSRAAPPSIPSTPVTAEGAQATGTYSFASTLSATRALNGGTVGLPSVVDQVILQMNRNVKNGNDQMSLQLHPADLGKITVKLSFGADGGVQGTVVADNPKTLEMLQKDSRSLERALQDAGLRTDPGSLQFSLGGQSGNQSGQTALNNKNQKDGAGDGTLSANNSLEDTSGLVDLGAIAETYYITPNGVNISV